MYFRLVDLAPLPPAAWRTSIRASFAPGTKDQCTLKSVVSYIC